MRVHRIIVAMIACLALAVPAGVLAKGPPRTPVPTPTTTPIRTPTLTSTPTPLSSPTAQPASSPTPGQLGLYVDPLNGIDADSGGGIDTPWRTLRYAFSRLQPGDTLYLRGGTYFESSLVVSNPGTESQPIVIRGYPGETAVIDSGYPEFRTPGNVDWELVDAATGEYRSVRSAGSGYIYAYVGGISGYENERVALVPYQSAAAFRATTDQYVKAKTAFYVGPGTFKGPDGRIHIRLTKTADLRNAESRYGVVFAEENADPRDYSIIISQASRTLRVNASYLVFKDIVFNQAEHTISLSANAHHVVFEGITAWMGDDAVETAESGVHDITLTHSRFYGDAPYWIFWSDMKDSPAPADLLRGTSIDMRYGTHAWEISYNHIRGSGQDLISTNTDERDISIHHNRLENCGDDAFELEGTENVGRIWIYENYIGNCLTAVAPGQDSPQFDGPLYVYRNVFSLLRNPPINRKAGINTWNGGGRFGYEYAFKQDSGNTHYYHNTVVMLNSSSGMNVVPGTPNFTYVANNLLVMINGRVQGDYTRGPGQIVDGNLYWKMNTVDSSHLVSSYDTVPALFLATGLEENGLGNVAKRGTDPWFAALELDVVDPSQSVWALAPSAEVHKPSDFLLGAGSPAIAAGIVLPTHPTLGAMPDSRASRDIGAIPSTAKAGDYDIFPFVPTNSP